MEPGLYVTFFTQGSSFENDLPPVGPLEHLVIVDRRIVADRKDADTVVMGTCFDSRRLKTVHSEIFLHDRASGASIWQDIVRRHYNPPPLQKAVDDTAVMILAHLGESIQEAQRK